MKRRSSASGLNERSASPIVKRTKVHAQRKFAQGSNNFVTTPTKLPKPSESTPQVLSPESNSVAENNDRELNNFSNIPTVDDFLTFLCYRETEVLPERLNYLNTPQFESIPIKKKPSKSNSTVPAALPSSKSSTDQNKASDKINSNFKSKKKVPEYKLRSNDIKCKPILNKTSRSLALKHNQRLRKIVQTKFNDNKLTNFKGKTISNKCPAVTKNGVNAKVNDLTNHPITRALNSIKESPKVVEPESVVKRVTRRNSNLNALAEKIDLPPAKSTPNRTPSKTKSFSGSTKELSVTVENTRIPAKRLSAKPLRVPISKFEPSPTPSKPVTRSTRSSTAKLESNYKTPVTSTRPTRKTKEAATLYMETLGRDLLRDDESFDEDDGLSLDSFLELPSFEQAKPKKEPAKSPKTPVKSAPPKSHPQKLSTSKKTPLKTPSKAKPCKNSDKNKSQMAKLNDELKKIVEDKPLKERLEGAKKDDQALQKLEKGVQLDDGVLEDLMEIDDAETIAPKNCDNVLPRKDKKVTLTKSYDSIENIEIPEFTIQQRGNSDTECASKIVADGKPRRASSVSVKDCKTKKPTEKFEIPPQKNKREKSIEKTVTQKGKVNEIQPPSKAANEEKLPVKNKDVVKNKGVFANDDKLSRKLPIKNKIAEDIAEISIVEDKLPPEVVGKNKDLGIAKKALPKQKPSPKILVKNKNVGSIKNIDAVEEKSDAKIPIKNKKVETIKEMVVEEKSQSSIPDKNKNIETIKDVGKAEEELLPEIPCKNLATVKETTVSKPIPDKVAVEGKDLKITEEICSSEKQPDGNKNLGTPDQVLIDEEKRVEIAAAKNKDEEIPKELPPSTDKPSLKMAVKRKDAGIMKEVSSLEIKTVENIKPEGAVVEPKATSVEKKSVDSTAPKLPNVEQNATSTRSKIKIIRAKSKSSEDDDDDDGAKERVSTSAESRSKKSDSGSCEESETDTPRLIFAGDKTVDDKTMMQTLSASSSKMFCLESKKIIFKKNKTPVVETKEETSPRKAEAFSAVNENSVYAFEPDLPTTSPPFRRLKPVTPPKSIISGNSIAVQVNFESNTKIECSSSSEAQVSSTTDCDDRVFYIPIQNSGTNSTLGVAVKLDTDGANQKIIMSATLVTKSPSFTTTTATTVASTSATLETSNIQIESAEQNDEPAPKKPAMVRETDKIVATADSQTSTQTLGDSPSSTVVSPKPNKKICAPLKTGQSVKIVKINKCKKPQPLLKPKAKPVKSKSSNKKITPETTKPTKNTAGEILEAPTFYPSEAEFNDPLKYIDTIRSVAEKFGLCRIVPPSTFRPECKVADEMRFTAYNQYVHKMLHRWGPNVKEMMAIKKFLATQNIHFTHPPWIGGMEVDLPRLYEMVQQCGGLKEVIEKERWHQVADVMRIPKLAQDRITKLDDIYCKYLLPYDILSHNEREKLFEEIEKEWEAHVKNPNDDDEVFDDVDECIVKGRTMPLSCFYRIARNTMMMCFGNVEGQPEGPSTESIETEFWNHVSKRKSHICVHSGSIDTGMHGYGFSMAKNSTFRKHPWNLKVLTNNSASILRSLGPIIGVTVPTLHVGMLYSACCWYRDPHGLPWIEYLHTGANKIWYGIPDEYSEQFRKAMLFLVPQYCRDKRLWLPSDTIMIPPPLLAAHNVPLSRVVQQPGQFIVVFPKSFTSCISTGYMVSESVYFAHTSWLNSAKQIFSDMQESCEPSVFSLEQLLISVATDVRASLVILGKILPLLIELRDSEVASRNQLDKLGLSASEKMKINKKRKSKASFNDEDNYECEICRANLFVSLVINSHEQTNYCLKHAVNLLQKKPAQVKYCKLMYAYTKEELEEIIRKVEQRIESKGNRKPNVKQNVAN